VLYSGFGVGQKWSIADMCWSKNTPPYKCCMKAWQKSKLKWKVVFIVLIYTTMTVDIRNVFIVKIKKSIFKQTLKIRDLQSQQ